MEFLIRHMLDGESLDVVRDVVHRAEERLQTEFLYNIRCKIEEGLCKDSTCCCCLEFDSIVYTSLRIITWTQDPMYCIHLHRQPLLPSTETVIEE